MPQNMITLSSNLKVSLLSMQVYTSVAPIIIKMSKVVVRHINPTDQEIRISIVLTVTQNILTPRSSPEESLVSMQMHTRVTQILVKMPKLITKCMNPSEQEIRISIQATNFLARITTKVTMITVE